MYVMYERMYVCKYALVCKIVGLRILIVVFVVEMYWCVV